MTLTLKQELQNLKDQSPLDFDNSLYLIGLHEEGILNPPIINWNVIERELDEIPYDDIDIQYVEELIHILKKSYYCKTLETIKRVREVSGFPLDSKGRPQIPTQFEVKTLNLKGMGLDKVFNLYNPAGYERINSGSVFPEIVTWELIASRKCFLLERVGYQFYREQKGSVECINLTSLIERRLEPYIVDCPWAVYSDTSI